MNQLDSIGGFVADQPVAREVTIGDKTETLYFRELGYADFRKVTQSEPADGQLKELIVLQHILRVGPDGSEEVSYEDVARLKRPVIEELSRIAWEVNGVTIKADGEVSVKN
jgi:hypothetical protein